jgi:peptidoglycan/xylan/chitin deacetylase (PgdA/CDA1 family)
VFGETVKSLLGHFLFTSRASRLLLGNAGVVVTFHRVQDAPDPTGLSVTARAFADYCSFFAKHFSVVPLGDLVDRLQSGRRVDRRLAITFDDGYLDNYEVAAPVLERTSLPATFFVVSRWMSTALVPWWDRDVHVRHPWMSWDQVRSLHRRGFTIGAHTRTHADLGRVDGRQAEDEIVGARWDLERALDARVDLFAVPYGRRGSISEANRELVRGAGFRCCCVSYGGINSAGSDPYRLNRIAVSPWYATPHQFGFDAALRRTLLAS